MQRNEHKCKFIPSYCVKFILKSIIWIKIKDVILLEFFEGYSGDPVMIKRYNDNKQACLIIYKSQMHNLLKHSGFFIQIYCIKKSAKLQNQVFILQSSLVSKEW